MVADPERGPAYPAHDPARVLVIDPLGSIFQRLQKMAMPYVLQRLTEPRPIDARVAPTCVVHAWYGDPRWSDLPIFTGPALIVTTAYRREDAADALERDLVGYLDATLGDAALERAVSGAVTRGELGFSRDIIGAWMRQRRATEAAAAAAAPRLTKRQHEIVSLIALGATDKEIASRLGIATTTAQKHVTNILQRLDVANRAAAVAVFAMQRRTA